MERYICIHGHFYQPPRENPWLEAIELQDSAYPFHDWNERITAECYAPNTASRILDDEGRITRIVNNYARINFNFGPTLLQWLKAKEPVVYQGILDADRESMELFDGHGSAMAQAYNHMIMPLANSRDKETQIIWGLVDFEHRFGRRPEGMWLPETAVDVESLELMAEYGITYTVLTPYQAKRVRRIGEEKWRDATGGNIDPTMPYVCNLPSGRRIYLFFYDGPISRAVAFEQLLASGEGFAERLMTGFHDEGTEPQQLVHIATDGETYGHHHRHGDMALAYALQYLEETHLARITNYSQYLHRFPPTHEAEILENTAWSCAHGIGRWKDNCGCNTGGPMAGSQKWRKPLRDALDELRDAMAPHYEKVAGQYLRDPWQARDDYIHVILERSERRMGNFFTEHALRELSHDEKVTVLKLLELQRHAMLMYTSCGWFFDDLSGIETVQVIQYAGRAIQLAEELFDAPFEEKFLATLHSARSNILEHGTGREIYEKWIRPSVSDLEKVGAHYALSSLWEPYGESEPVYSYLVTREDFETLPAGRARLGVGRVQIQSVITLEKELLTFGVLHFGDHNLIGGVRRHRGDEEYARMREDVWDAFSRADFPETIRRLDGHFGSLIYSLRSLFKDEQRKILDKILDSTLDEVESVYRQLYEHHTPLMRFLVDLGIPLPRALQTDNQFIVNVDLRRAIEHEVPDAARIRMLLDEARTWQVELDNQGLGYAFTQTLNRLAGDFYLTPEDMDRLEQLNDVVALAEAVPFEVDYSWTQNLYYNLLRNLAPRIQKRAEQDEAKARQWIEAFGRLGEQLSVAAR